MTSDTTISLSKPVQPAERIKVLDILRGIAIFGMIISHFAEYAEKVPSNWLSQVVADWVRYFIDDRFYTLFAILFGVGFAIQLVRATNRGENFIPRFLRRMFGLVCIGFVMEVGLGYSILYPYALCGLLLILVRKWSTKTLFILFLICVTLNPLYRIIKSTASSAIYGTELTIQKIKLSGDKIRTLQKAQFRRDSIAENTDNYITALKIRTEHFIHAQPTRIEVVINLLTSTFMLILLGFIAMRLKIFEEPVRNLKLIIALMIIGVVSCVVVYWGLPFFKITPSMKFPAVAFPMQVTLNFLSRGFTIFRDNWLSFTYAGIVLLLVANSPIKWFRRFSFFSITGRMALTNYFLQAMILNLMSAKYAFACPRFPGYMVPVYAVILFAILVLISRWWLNRFQYGPLEWLWRSLTYLKFQPMRLNKTINTEEK